MCLAEPLGNAVHLWVALKGTYLLGILWELLTFYFELQDFSDAP